MELPIFNLHQTTADDENAFVDKPGGLYQRVAFNYRSGGDQSAQGESGDRSTEDIAFIPPFVVPGHLQSKLVSFVISSLFSETSA